MGGKPIRRKPNGVVAWLGGKLEGRKPSGAASQKGASPEGHKMMIGRKPDVAGAQVSGVRQGAGIEFIEGVDNASGREEIRLERKVMSKDELLENKEELLAKYSKEHRKYNKPIILTKKERKVLGIGRDEGRASLRNVRIGANKVKLVCDQIKGKSIHEAYSIVRNTPKSASTVIFKLLKSAEANAVNNNGLDSDYLYVTEATASQGPTMKRIIPRARGSADRIKKRTSHISVVVKEKE